MNREVPVQLRLWGVRGSCPAAEPENLGYGGNTSCVEILCGSEPPLIFDAGTGIRGLGQGLAQRFAVKGAALNVFLTHFHWDHIQGIPFFAPLFLPSCEVHFHSTRPAAELRQILEGQMQGPYFTARSALKADLQYLEVPPDGVQAGELLIKPFPLSHPGGAAGYLISGPRVRIVYACDHEHGDRAIDRGLREHAQGVDVLIYDAQYTPEEYPRRMGWGHGTWLEAAKVARDAGVRQLVLSHHDPQHNDAAVSEIVSRASAEFANTIGAKEGWTVTL